MTCLAGASWVQGNILSRMPDPALRVLVVWVPFVGGTRQAINPSVLPDRRVTSLWDPNSGSSQWLWAHVTNQIRPALDYYQPFGAPPPWGPAPRPWLRQGRLVAPAHRPGVLPRGAPRRGRRPARDRPSPGSERHDDGRLRRSVRARRDPGGPGCVRPHVIAALAGHRRRREPDRTGRPAGLRPGA